MIQTLLLGLCPKYATLLVENARLQGRIELLEFTLGIRERNASVVSEKPGEPKIIRPTTWTGTLSAIREAEEKEHA